MEQIHDELTRKETARLELKRLRPSIITLRILRYSMTTSFPMSPLTALIIRSMLDQKGPSLWDQDSKYKHNPVKTCNCVVKLALDILECIRFFMYQLLSRINKVLPVDMVLLKALKQRANQLMKKFYLQPNPSWSETGDWSIGKK